MKTGSHINQTILNDIPRSIKAASAKHSNEKTRNCIVRNLIDDRISSAMFCSKFKLMDLNSYTNRIVFSEYVFVSLLNDLYMNKSPP